jgi:hypothetical protein
MSGHPLSRLGSGTVDEIRTRLRAVSRLRNAVSAGSETSRNPVLRRLGGYCSSLYTSAGLVCRRHPDRLFTACVLTVTLLFVVGVATFAFAELHWALGAR